MFRSSYLKKTKMFTPYEICFNRFYSSNSASHGLFLYFLFKYHTQLLGDYKILEPHSKPLDLYRCTPKNNVFSFLFKVYSCSCESDVTFMYV